MSAFDEESLLKRILNRTRLFGSNTNGSTSPVEPVVPVTVINSATDKPTPQSEEFRKAVEDAFKEQDYRTTIRQAQAERAQERLDAARRELLQEELHKPIPIVHGVKTMSETISEGAIKGMIPGSLRIGGYEERYRGIKGSKPTDRFKEHPDQEQKDREAKDREAAEMKAKLASMSTRSPAKGGYVGPGVKISEPVTVTYDIPPASFDTIDDKIGQVISDELDRFAKDTDEDLNAAEVIKRVLKRLKNIANYHEVDFHELTEQVMSEEKLSPEQVALNGVADAMTEYYTGEFSLDPTAFAMNTPKSLTVWKNAVEADGRTGYSKHAHIGGEEFIPTKAHVGKKGHIIVTFKPVQAEPYAWMEMPLTDCLNELAGFQQHFVRSELSVKWAEAQNAKQTAKKTADLEKFGATYNDFGSY